MPHSVGLRRAEHRRGGTRQAGRRSVQHDRIISFIDGRSYKTLKRHLTAHGLTPDSYRKRFGLPAGYPMTAPSYCNRGSSLTREFGLGSSSGGEGTGTGRRRAS